jgi:hypothetical protein
MSEAIPLIAIVALWIPIAAGIAWLFERRAHGYRR